jgi:hypothetical protein
VKLKGTYKGYEYTAALRRDGRISFAGDSTNLRVLLDVQSVVTTPIAGSSGAINRKVEKWVRLNTLRE